MSESTGKYNKLLNKIFSGVLIVTLLYASYYFGNCGKPTEMGLMIASCSIALAFTNIDKIVRFKGASFEIEMKAEEAVKTAYAKIDELNKLEIRLKELATKVVKPVLELIASQGSLGNYENASARLKIRNELINLLNSMKIAQEDIKNITANFNKKEKSKIAFQIRNLVFQDSKFNEDIKKIITDLPLEDSRRLDTKFYRSILGDALSNELETAIKNLELYQEKEDI